MHAGTLLGQHFGGNIMPWDDDLDFAIMAEDEPAFRAALPPRYDGSKDAMQTLTSRSLCRGNRCGEIFDRQWHTVYVAEPFVWCRDAHPAHHVQYRCYHGVSGVYADVTVNAIFEINQKPSLPAVSGIPLSALLRYTTVDSPTCAPFDDPKNAFYLVPLPCVLNTKRLIGVFCKIGRCCARFPGRSRVCLQVYYRRDGNVVTAHHLPGSRVTSMGTCHGFDIMSSPPSRHPPPASPPASANAATTTAEQPPCYIV